MDKYICRVCATIYDPDLGDSEDGIPSGTPFEKLPEDWVCPVCGSPKNKYMVLPEEEYQKLVNEKLIKRNSN